MIYIIISILSLLISYFSFKKITNMKLIKLNFISSIFYKEILLYCFLGSLLVILNKDNHYIISKIANSEIRVKGYWYIIMFIVGLPNFIYLWLKVTRLNLQRLNDSFELKRIKTIISKKDDEIYLGCCLFLGAGILSSIYVFYNIGSIPIFEIFSNKNLDILRINIGRNFQGNEYIKNLVFLIIPPLFTFITYIYYIKFKILKWRILFYLFFLLSFLAKTHNLEKAPIFFFLINFYMLKIMLLKKIQKKEIYFLYSIVIIGIISIYAIKGQLAFSYNTGVIGRVILSQIAGFYASLEIFPKVHPFLEYNSANTMGRILMEILNPKGIEKGVAGVMNTLFMAEAYSYLSKLGIYLSLVYVSFIIVIFCKAISILKKTPITLAVYNYLGFSYLSQNLTGGIIAYIYSPTLIIIVAYTVLLYFIGKLLKKSKRYER